MHFGLTFPIFSRRPLVFVFVLQQCFFFLPLKNNILFIKNFWNFVRKIQKEKKCFELFLDLFTFFPLISHNYSYLKTVIRGRVCWKINFWSASLFARLFVYLSVFCIDPILFLVFNFYFSHSCFFFFYWELV